jgi:hypothetical protein
MHLANQNSLRNSENFCSEEFVNEALERLMQQRTRRQSRQKALPQTFGAMKAGFLQHLLMLLRSASSVKDIVIQETQGFNSGRIAR